MGICDISVKALITDLHNIYNLLDVISITIADIPA